MPGPSPSPRGPSAPEPPETPTAAFVDAVKDALDHLYDFARLSSHPLARWLLPDEPPRGVSRAQALRQRVIDAIESMNPGRRLQPSAPQRRAYQLLDLRYVEALPYREVMRTLALSQPQYHREQRHAVQTLAICLWEMLPGPPPGRERPLAAAPEPAARPGITGVEATSHLSDRVEVGHLLADVVALMTPVDTGRQVRVRLTPPPEPLVVTTSRTALRQTVISAIEALLDEGPERELVLSADCRSGVATIAVDAAGPFSPVGPEPATNEHLDQARQLAQSLGGELRFSRGRDGTRAVLRFPTQRRTVLVVEDNRDMVQLIARFLADQPYTVLSAASVETGLQLAERARPDLVLLDVMMPHKDGWDALQHLRHHPATGAIPVVVCSVLAEERLAGALGAVAYLRKPVTRSALLQAIELALSVQPRPAAGSRASS
jgi:CheY-like chemotaxis protein